VESSSNRHKLSQGKPVSAYVIVKDCHTGRGRRRVAYNQYERGTNGRYDTEDKNLLRDGIRIRRGSP
jgi:hypothetical protein